MLTTMRCVVVTVGIVAIALTLLPLLPSNEWWIRIWDFPRLQVASLLITVLLAVPLMTNLRSAKVAVFWAFLVLALGWQVSRIAPYTPLHSVQAEAVSACKDGPPVSLLVINVLAGNENAEPVINLVRQTDPDLLLLVETDDWWHRHLKPLDALYPYQISQPQNNGYGMHLFSDLELVDPTIRFLVEEGVPSIKSGVRLKSEKLIHFYGLHPKPPPLQDTAERDAELLIVGREVRKEEVAAIVAGDLNDVAWSRTSHLFQEISGLLDPRIGRGPYATFNANWPLLRWPLDHVFFEDAFQLLRIAVLADVGSDHFPLLVELCHSAGADITEEPRPEPSEVEAAQEAIEEGLEEGQD